MMMMSINRSGSPNEGSSLNMKCVTVLGSLNFDLVTKASRFPAGGETLNAQSFETHHGGKGANEALAARRLSDKNVVNVKMIGRVGKDAFGDELLSSMKEEGIDMSQVLSVKDVPTGTASIFVETESGENRILFYFGANGTLKTSDVTEDVLKGSDLLIVQNEVPLEVAYHGLKVAHGLGIKTVYNPSPVEADPPLEYFKYVDYLIVNSSEAQVLSKSDAPIDDNVELAQKAIKPLAETVGSKNIIITLGKNGSIYYSPESNDSGSIPANKVDRIVDTTGAGDTFLGSFSSKIATGAPITDALKFASKAASIAVTRNGAAEGIPYLTEI